MDNASFWDKAAAKYAKDPISDIKAYAQTRDRMRAILQPHHRVLELGCGTGSTALELADCVDTYIGTDVSSKMIEIAQSKQTKNTPSHLCFSVCDAAILPSGEHDVIIALNVLHLLPDLEKVLSQIFNSLPSGGLLIAKTGLLKDGSWLLPWIIPLMRAIGKAPYVRNLSEAALLNMLEKTGFLVSETMTQGGVVPRMFTIAKKP